MGYTPKTMQTDEDVRAFIEAAGTQRAAEGRTLLELMRRVSGFEPKMWGPSMIGFGSYHYRTNSGSEGDWFPVGFSPRKAKISLYFSCDLDEYAAVLERLGKHTRGRGCVYVTKLEDIDLEVLEELVALALQRPDHAN